MDKNPNAKIKQAGGDRPLAYSWCLWEKYQEAYIQNSTNYDKNLHVIYTYDTLEKFALLWKYTTYSRPSELFFDMERDVSKKILIDEEGTEEKIVDGLFVFKKGIQPKWEDPENQQGCSISLDLYNLSGESIDRIWKDMIFAVTGQNFPFSEAVNGFRILDRMKKHRFIKFELWMSCGVAAYKPGSPDYQKNDEMINAITEYCHELINRTHSISIYNLIKKEHFVANKVN